MDSRLKTARLAHDLSQSQLAKAAGINLQMLQHYEQGVRDLSGAKLATLLKLCQTEKQRSYLGYTQQSKRGEQPRFSYFLEVL